MPYNISGEEITITGTENNLAFLLGITGVSSQRIGEVEVLDIGTYHLVIDVGATLYVAKNRDEQLIVEGDANNDITKITVNGNLIAGDDSLDTDNAFHQYNRGVPAIKTTGDEADNPTGINGNGVAGRRPGISVAATGSFQCYGQTCSFLTGFGAYDGAEIVIRRSQIYARNSYIYGENTKITDSTIIGSFSYLAAYQEWSNVSLQDTFYINVSGSTPTIDAVIFNMPKGNYTLGAWGSDSGNPLYRMRDAFLGSDYESTTLNSQLNSQGNANKQYSIIFEKRLTFTVKNSDKIAVEDADIYIFGDTFSSAENYITDPSGQVIEQVFEMGSNLNVAGNTTIQETRNGIGQDKTDTYNVKVVKYGYNFFEATLVMKGNGVTINSYNLVSDSLITEQDGATALSYTTQIDAYQAYDHLEAIIIRDYNNENETYVTRNNDILNARDLDVTVLDATGQASISGNMLTLYRYNGNLITTGTVTGKELIEGSVIDATQDSTLSEINGATFSVYPTDSDRDSKTNAFASNVTSWATLFSSLPSSVVFVSAELGGTRYPFDITMQEGVNTFDTSIAGALGSIQIGLEVINRNIQETSKKRIAREEL